MSFPLLTRSMHNRLIRTRGKEPDTSQQQQYVYEHTCASGRFFFGMADYGGWGGLDWCRKSERPITEWFASYWAPPAQSARGWLVAKLPWWRPGVLFYSYEVALFSVRHTVHTAAALYQQARVRTTYCMPSRLTKVNQFVIYDLSEYRRSSACFRLRSCRGLRTPYHVNSY